VSGGDIGLLFDHCIGALLELQGYVEAKRLGGLEIDRQLKLDRGLDGKLARLRALEDSIGIGRRAPIIIELINSVGQQAAEFSEDSALIDGREAVATCQRYDLCTMDVREGIRHHDQAATRRGHAAAAPPRSVMNSRRFTAQSLQCLRSRIAQLSTAEDCCAAGFRPG
jgi:hypothetical protein